MNKGAEIYYKNFSPEKCMEFCHPFLTGRLTEKGQAEVLSKIYNLSNKDEISISEMLIQEASLNLDPTSIRYRFSYAWDLGSKKETEFVAYARYDQIKALDNDVAPCLNNMSIIVHSSHQSLANSLQESSARLGNAVAIGNISRKLISMGLVDGAQEIIENVELSNQPDTVLSAKLALNEKKREIEKQSESALEIARNDARRFRSFATYGYDYFRNNLNISYEGKFVSEDGSTKLNINVDNRQITAEIDGILLNGECKSHFWMIECVVSNSETGASLLLGTFQRILITGKQDNSILLMQLKSSGEGSRVSVRELFRELKRDDES